MIQPFTAGTDEAKEGRNAFLEKRPPDFSETGWLP